MTKRPQDDDYGAAETERRREAALKRMLSTPHKPHNESGKKRKEQKRKQTRIVKVWKNFQSP